MSLLQEFKENSDKRFIFYKPNGGNYGDNIIRLGARAVARIAGIQSVSEDVTNHSNFEDDVVVYYHGVGGIGTQYPNVVLKTFRMFEENKVNKFIWGPSTVFDEPAQLEKEFAGFENYDFTFYARERKSYSIMKSLFNFKVKLDDCPSLSLTPNDFDVYSSGGHGKYLFLRKDVERTNLLPSLKVDYSKTIDPCHQNDCGSFEDWVKFHQEADEIVTNRLHSAIMGSVLGKKVTLFPNFYYKNKEVWDYSLKERGVRFVEA